MSDLLSSIKIEVNPLIYLKDPESSDLGRKILSTSLTMIDELGMEHFTFRKLAKELKTTESSIYRYFESKHKLLLYFYNWYWAWLEYKIVFGTNNIEPSSSKLKKAIEIICQPIKNEKAERENISFSLRSLINIVISESSKAYLIKEVDEENKAGFFLAFKTVVKRLVKIVHEIDPNYPHAHTLVSTCIEGILHQYYFARHLPSLSDVSKDSDQLADIFFHIIYNNLKQQGK
ncbi:TetR/AcrR family transcriptional regulator [Marivirga sp. S37H4]|uniref:TetR/AcrR family transcriptional regulator n=1 Tax=Marivirga aurantiaca TaxID=2802615 RepID=A0A934X133_9BACT|nr:TetR/AcrR family transcriptional regulator [Marivirga aurantiaca]MBK6266734.1 TetR/AcrR family transcriptional regulator [Marivirga aurantiaca]